MDVKKALGSVSEKNMGGSAVALDGDKSYIDEQEDADQLRAGPARHVCLWCR